MAEYTLEELSLLTKAQPFGNKAKKVSGVAALDQAQNHEVSFLANNRYLDQVKTSQAGVICVSQVDSLLACSALGGQNFLISEDPSSTFQQIAKLFLDKEQKPLFSKIHPSSVIDPSANIAETATIGPFVFIGPGVEIDKNSIIYPHSFIGPNCKIGSNTTIYSSASIRENCRIGSYVIIQPGAVIGSCGFGYLPQKDGSWQKLEQLGNVIIEDFVEIGANTTIDRARFKNTVIKKGAKIDNLVQIAHNVEIGENSAIASQSGISGSSKLGKNVILAGQVGVAGHLELADQVIVAAKAGVSKNLKTGKYRGAPAIAMAEHNRQMVYFRKLEKYVKKIQELESKIKLLEETLKA